MIEYGSWAIIGTVPSTARQRVIIIVVFVRRHFIAFGTIREHSRAPAAEGASNGGWQVVFGDEVTEHHFCNSHRFRCINLLRMLKNSFWDKMHVPRACSVAQMVTCAMQLESDARNARMLRSAVCACAMHYLGMRSMSKYVRETFHGKDSSTPF